MPPFASAARTVSRRFLLPLLLLGLPATPAPSQEPPAAPAETGLRLGLLLDTSAEMGFLVPQARKEIRWMNQALVARGRQTLAVEEIAGASLDREGSLAVPARRNALLALRRLLEEKGAGGVYWMTALRGRQSGDALFEIETLLKPEGNRPARPLVIRHLWQDQVQAAAAWVRHPPDPSDDPLAPQNRPFEWYRLAKAGGGVVVRSWQAPPEGEIGSFGFPHRVAEPALLRRMGIAQGQVTMDTRWTFDLASRFGFRFSYPEDSWLPAVTGRRWLSGQILVPHLDAETTEARNAAVFDSLRARESIAEDLARIPARKLGVLFGFGYLGRDRDRIRGTLKPAGDWRSQYLEDLSRIVRETREHLAAAAGNSPDRVYASEYLELASAHPRTPDTAAFARRLARLVREEGVDAVYFLTNGYTGGGDYGTFRVDEPLIAAAVREAGVRLYVRVPFELGVIPMRLQRLALASGGGVFLGRADDPDWDLPAPTPAWPEPEAASRP